MMPFGASSVNRWKLVLVSVCFLASFASGQHECDRECIRGSPSRTCYYRWTMEVHVSMGKSCGRCPFNSTDCYRVNCIPVNGVARSVTVINRQMPGPPINVCQYDRVIVDLQNHAGTDATAIHWHGLNQYETPFMDGVPMVTQCPILPFNIFRYNFVAEDVGTHFYHSHFGFQRTDGANGMIVVRQPKIFDPNRGTYDFDLSTHQMLVSDWINRTGEDMFNAFYHGDEQYFPYLDTIIVNGRARLREFRNVTTGTRHYTPYSSFVVRKGFRYRFRLCSNANWMCPVEVSVDKHDLLVISADGDPVRPYRVNAVVVNPGERFDFVINANQSIGTYWMQFRGLFQCARMGTVGRAILKYETALDMEPPAPSRPPSPFLVLNPVNVNFTNSSHVSLMQLESLTRDASLDPIPDRKFFIPFNLYPNLNPDIDDPTALLALINATSFLSPPSPLLTQFGDVPPEYICTDTNRRINCTAQFCKCTYILRVNIDEVVEIILVDEGRTNQTNVHHPFHMHGHHFRILGGSLANERVTVDEIKRLDALGQLVRNLNSPVLKDTVSVPHGGYVILRFHAFNPGFWAFHCHVELHMETGMMLVFQVGDWRTIPPRPDGFPTCSNYPYFIR